MRRIIFIMLTTIFYFGFLSNAKAVYFTDPGLDFGNGYAVDYDIQGMDATYDANNLYLSFTFDRLVTIYDVARKETYPNGDQLYTICGYVGFDIDRNTSTGDNFLPLNNPVSIGVDYSVNFCMFDKELLGIKAWGSNYEEYLVNLGINGNKLDLIVPLNKIGSNGILDFVLISGNSPDDPQNNQYCNIYLGNQISDIAYGNTVEGNSYPSVPEPGTLMLLGSVCVGIIGLRRKVK